jgi:hypothetical protein
VLERPAGLDPLSRLGGDLVAALVRDVRIEHQDELVLLVDGDGQNGGRL